MTELIIVVGVTGVGKTSVIDQARQNTEKNVEIVNYGSKVIEIGKYNDLIESRDDITDLPREKYNNLQRDTVDEISQDIQESDADAFILDTHASLDTPSGYRPGLTLTDIKQLNPQKLVQITAEPFEIQHRRRDDDSRDRDPSAESSIEEQQQVSQQMATSFSTYSRAPLSLISNNNAGLRGAAKGLTNVIEA